MDECNFGLFLRHRKQCGATRKTRRLLLFRKISEIYCERLKKKRYKFTARIQWSVGMLILMAYLDIVRFFVVLIIAFGDLNA